MLTIVLDWIQKPEDEIKTKSRNGLRVVLQAIFGEASRRGALALLFAGMSGRLAYRTAIPQLEGRRFWKKPQHAESDFQRSFRSRRPLPKVRNRRPVAGAPHPAARGSSGLAERSSKYHRALRKLPRGRTSRVGRNDSSACAEIWQSQRLPGMRLGVLRQDQPQRSAEDLLQNMWANLPPANAISHEARMMRHQVRRRPSFAGLPFWL